MRPSLGRIVIVKGIQSNGSDEHPAIVTQVWGNAAVGPVVWSVNVTLFPDCGPPQSVTSINLFERKDLATEWREEQAHKPTVAFWPERA